MKVSYRDKKQRKENSHYFEFEGVQSFESFPLNKVIVWQDEANLCNLDIDYHGSGGCHDVYAKIQKVYPPPIAYDISKKGGVHLYYIEDNSIGASCLASLAYFSAMQVFSDCTGLEVITKTFLVENITENTSYRQIEKEKAFSLFGSGYDENEITHKKELFSFQGSKKRVNSNLCPFEYHGILNDTNPSLQVSEWGVYCFRCSKGVPWEGLTGKRNLNSNLYKYAKKLLYWDLASKLFMTYIRFDLLKSHDENISKKAYYALLKLIHNDDYRIEWCTDNIYLYRNSNGNWVSPQGNAYGDLETRNLIKMIPFLNCGGFKKDKSGEIVRQFYRGEMLKNILPERFLTNGEDLSEYLPTCDVVQGVQVLENTRSLKHYYQRKEFEKYQKSNADAEKAIAGIDFLASLISGKKDLPATNLIMLLLALTFAEEFDGERPLLIATGVSSGGKSLLPQLACAMLRCKYSLCPASISNPEKRWEAFGTALFQGARCFINDEALKFTNPNDHLNYSSLECSHRILYKGFMNIKNRSCTVVTGITLPKDFQENGQFMRRATILPRLDTAKNWDASVFLNPSFLENRETKLHVDNIISYVMSLIPEFESFSTFNSLWKDVKSKLDTRLLTEENTEITNDSVSDRAEKIKEFLRYVAQEGKEYNGSKMKGGLSFPKARNSKSWEFLQSLFLGLDITAKLPVEILDYFSEFDLADKFNIENFAVEITATRDNLIVRLRSGRKIIDFKEII